MSPHLRAVVWAAACSAVVLGVGLCLPLWKRASVGGYCVSYQSMPVWRGLTDSRPMHPLEAKAVGGDNRNNCLMVLAVAGGVGPLVYWVRRPRTRPLEADDYADGLGGPQLDGRAVPG